MSAKTEKCRKCKNIEVEAEVKHAENLYYIEENRGSERFTERM